MRKSRKGSALLARHSVLALEALNTTSGIDDLLLTREERVAHVADLDLDLRQCRLGLKAIATDTADLAINVGGMDIGLHFNLPDWQHTPQGRLQPVAPH